MTTAGPWSAAPPAVSCTCGPPPATCSPTTGSAPTARPVRPWPGGCWTAGSPTPGGRRSRCRPVVATTGPTSPSWSRSATGPTSSTRCSPPSRAHVPVVVVDDASADPAPVAAVAGRTEPGWSRTPSTAARPRPATRACAAVATPYVAFVDSDVLPEPGWLGAAGPALRRPAAGGGRPAGARAAAGPATAGWTGTSRPGPPSTSVPHPPSYVATAPWRYLPSACLVGAHHRPGRRLRRGDAGGRGRRPGLAARRGRLDGALRPHRRGPAPAPDPPRAVARAQGVLRHRVPRTWPPGTATPRHLSCWRRGRPR